jgi:sulfite exporter TauE/SafE
MGLGTSLFLIAVGAILKFAVTDSVSGVDLTAVGVILMVVGAIGLLISLFYATLWADRRREAAVVREPVVREPVDRV